MTNLIQRKQKERKKEQESLKLRTEKQQEDSLYQLPHRFANEKAYITNMRNNTNIDATDVKGIMNKSNNSILELFKSY